MPDTTRRTELATVFLVVLVDLLGFGIVLPLLPFYASRYEATPLTIGLLYSSYSMAQLVFSPLWGGWSDRIGRRPVMLLSTFGSFLSYVLFGLSHSLEVLFLSRIVAGIMGGNISTAQAYVADVTSREDRARGMGLIGAAFGIGFVLGPAMAALLIHPALISLAVRLGFQGAAGWLAHNPYAMPGFFAAGMSLASFLMVLTRLPETVKPGAAPKEKSARLGVFSAEFWDIVLAGIQFPRRRTVTLLFSCVALLSFAQSTLYGSFPLFCWEKMGLSDRQVGYLFAFMGLIAIIVQGGLIRRLVPVYGEKRLFLTGCALMAAAFFALPAAGNPGGLLAVLAVLSVGGSLSVPTLTSMVSKGSGSDRYGQTMGVSQSLAGMGRVAGPAWGGWMYGLAGERAFSFTALAVMLAVMAGIEFLRRDGG